MNTLAKIQHTVQLLGLKRTVQFAVKRLFNPNPLHLWNHDRIFHQLYREIQEHTLVDIRRAYMIYQLARHAANVSGEAAEVGVYKGGTARLIARVLEETNKKVHIFDTFTGMPPTSPGKDFVRAGDFSDTSLDAVASYLADQSNIVIHPGLFPDSAGPVTDTLFSFAYIDVDAYRSVLDCCTFFYARMHSGGMIVFDDYGFITCEGARLAVDEFCQTTVEKPCYLPTGQCVLFKL